jgi:adenylyltransferase/sulfurtransferase
MGGLGCPAVLALAQAGIRRLTIADPDVVDASNLHRQPWYRSSDIGTPKVEAAVRRVSAAFPSIQLRALSQRVDRSSAAALFGEHGAIIDGTDDVETKFLLSDMAVLHRVPLVYGGVLRVEGQAMLIGSGGPCLRCLFEQPAGGDAVLSCAQAGVLGTVAGVVGAMQALLALSALAGERHRYGQLFRFDGWTLRERVISVQPEADCPACAGALAGGPRVSAAAMQ